MPVEVVRAAIRCCYTVARHLGITDGEADAVVAEALAAHRIIGDGSNPPHSVALFRGLAEPVEG